MNIFIHQENPVATKRNKFNRQTEAEQVVRTNLQKKSLVTVNVFAFVFVLIFTGEWTRCPWPTRTYESASSGWMSCMVNVTIKLSYWLRFYNV